MICFLPEKPAKVFDHLDDHHMWIQGHDGNGPYGYVAIKFEGDKAVIHLELVRWAKCIMYRLLVDWEAILNTCRLKGAKTLVAANYNYTDPRWPKLIRHFGFPEPEIMALSHREV
jgi:hypothetical protein